MMIRSAPHAVRGRWAALVALTALLTACSGPIIRVTTSAPGSASALQELLYVCNQDDASVSIIDMGTNRVVRTVDLRSHGFSANAKPHHVAVEPDGSFWYVTLIGENRIAKFDRDDRLVGQATFETPGMLALHPTEDVLFVARSMTAVNPPRRVGVLRRSDMSIDELPVFFPRPHALALEPRSGTLYTASLAVNQMAAIDVAREDVELHDVPGAAHALMQFAVSPDGRTLVISAELSHRVIVFDITEPLQPRQVAEIAVERQPFDPVFTPDGRRVYLGNKAADAVTVIDIDRHALARVIRGPGIAQPHGAAVSADGRRVYISSNNLGTDHGMPGHGGDEAGGDAPGGHPDRTTGTVVVIDTETDEIVEVIRVGRNATGIATRTRRP